MSEDAVRQLKALVDYLTREKRVMLDALDKASELEGLRPDPECKDGVASILDETAARVAALIDFKAMAFFLVDEADGDLRLAVSRPDSLAAFFQRELDALIEDRTLGWSMARSRPVLAPAVSAPDQLLLHSVRTASRTRGMFVGVLHADRQDILDIAYSLLSFTLFTCANLVESYELYKYINEMNANLRDSVDKLAESERQLLTYKHELEIQVVQRTSELMQERDFVAAVFDTAEALMVVLDSGNRVVRLNAACERFTGVDTEAARGRDMLELFVPREDHFAVADALRRLRAGESPQHFECEWRDRQGRLRRISWSNAILRDVHGGVSHIISVGIDVSDRNEALRKLAEAEATYRAIFENAVEGIFQNEPDGTFTRVNPAMARMLGYDTPAELMAAVRNIRGVMCATDVEHDRFFADLNAFGMVEDFTFEALRRDGRKIWVSVSARAITDSLGRLVRIDSMAEDITERKLLEMNLRQKAMFDALTNIPNRTLLRDRLEQALVQNKRLGGLGAVLYIDLDKFKPINDTHGHHIGDEVLKEAAVRLERRVRRSDTVARLGGDEFAVLLTSLASPGDATTVAQQIVLALCAPYVVQGVRCDVGASIGVAIFPDQGVAAEDLLRKADAAMYAAKEAGGCCYMSFSDGMSRCPLHGAVVAGGSGA
ncbi:MAG: diguanylate cyclase [Desulfovibrionaceae bacterium]